MFTSFATARKVISLGWHADSEFLQRKDEREENNEKDAYLREQSPKNSVLRIGRRPCSILAWKVKGRGETKKEIDMGEKSVTDSEA